MCRRLAEKKSLQARLQSAARRGAQGAGDQAGGGTARSRKETGSKQRVALKGEDLSYDGPAAMVAEVDCHCTCGAALEEGKQEGKEEGKQDGGEGRPPVEHARDCPLFLGLTAPVVVPAPLRTATSTLHLAAMSVVRACLYCTGGLPRHGRLASPARAARVHGGFLTRHCAVGRAPQMSDDEYAEVVNDPDMLDLSTGRPRRARSRYRQTPSMNHPRIAGRGMVLRSADSATRGVSLHGFSGVQQGVMRGEPRLPVELDEGSVGPDGSLLDASGELRTTTAPARSPFPNRQPGHAGDGYRWSPGGVGLNSYRSWMVSHGVVRCVLWSQGSHVCVLTRRVPHGAASTPRAVHPRGVARESAGRVTRRAAAPVGAPRQRQHPQDEERADREAAVLHQPAGRQRVLAGRGRASGWIDPPAQAPAAR